MKSRLFRLLSLTLLLALSIVVLVSCGNRTYFQFEHDTYNYIHCTVTNKCYKIKNWNNNQVGIRVETEDYGLMYFSEGTYILISSKCPICEEHKE